MTTSTPPVTLATWLLAQLDAEEAVARAATPGPWRVVEQQATVSVTNRWQRVALMQRRANDRLAEASAAHIAAQDPATTLARIAALREVVETCTMPLAATEECQLGWESQGDTVLRALAQPYVGRPGFKEEWA
jgi:hypothetical protein